MNQENAMAQISRFAFAVCLILFTCFTAAQAQAVIPSVCITPNPRAGTATLSQAATAGQNNFFVSAQDGIAISLNMRAVINPGGATEETIPWANSNNGFFFNLRSISNGNTYGLTYAHNAGETVQWFSDTTAVWSYNNTTNANVSIPRGVSSNNYFSPGIITYSGQPNFFLPGIHTALSFDLPTRDGLAISWFLQTGQATASKNAPVCAQITYQGRLTDTGAAANGTYDLQFTVYDQLTGGTAQSEAIVVEDATVASGVFTVQLNFNSSFYNNQLARYLEIGVRPGTSTGAFTILALRQPITKVPFAVNADVATNATNATNATQLGGVAANQFLQTGGGTISGSLTVNGTLNAALGQDTTTAYGTGLVDIAETATTYTLVPGLTQTITVPANSVAVISTDGGIQSRGEATNSFSVVDTAIFIDGAIVAQAGQRRIMIVNNPIPQSVGNWSFLISRTLTAGSHTIEVRARSGQSGSATAIVSGDMTGAPLLQAQLTVTIIKK